jgi:flagellar biosynthesis anti-sigma factor FlgM
MRIFQPNPPQVTNERSDRADGSSARAKKSANPGAKEQAAVVSIGRAASQAASAAERIPDSVAKRLEAVRAQLRNGTYQIDFAKLAERIVDDEVDRGSGQA